MPLHRDIFWVGRQWAVTGQGMQAVDQKQKSKFDIEISRLWDDDLLDGLSGERWFNLDDFSQGLAIARARYPEPPHRAKPAPKAEPVKPEAGREAKRDIERDVKGDVKPKTASRATAPDPANADRILQAPARQATPAPPRSSVSPLKEGVPLQPPPSRPRSAPVKPVPEVEPAPPVVAKFAMRLEGGSAKFTPMWRIRIKR
jgi:hypothetical protein